MSHTTITIPATGAEMPVIGVGTFGSDHVSASEMAQAVKLAFWKSGYRAFDLVATSRLPTRKERIGKRSPERTFPED